MFKLIDGKYSISLIALVFMTGLISGCMESIEPEEVIESTTVNVFDSEKYSGCKSATALDSSRIKVEFDFPSDATEVEVYRDGFKVLSSHNPLASSFIDTGLDEGETYEYQCSAKINGNYSIGKNTVEETTLIVTPPNFSGIESAVATSATSVKITWPPAVGGSKVKYFKVFGSMVSSIDFSGAEKHKTDDGTTYTATLTGLADDMPYKFGVRACNASDVCDTNTVEIDLTTSDNGAPGTTGPTSYEMIDSEVVLTIPWKEVMGAVSKRRIFRSSNSDGSSAIAVGVIDVNVVSDLSTPSTTFNDSSVSENTTYYYYVRDEDPSSNLTEISASNLLQVDVGDLTSPIFTGLSGISYGANTESTIDLSFTAIASEPGDPSGATYYMVYETFSDGGTPADPCSSGSLIKTLDATSYTSGTSYDVNLSGKISRRTYSYCMQAQDAAGNNSSNTSVQTITMKDLTAPTFDGIQALVFDNVNDKFIVSWNTSSSADIKEYKLRVWKNTATPGGGDITTLTKDHATYPTSAEFNSGDFNYTDGDSVYVIVDACDDAGTPNSYNTIDNCTSISVATAKKVDLADQTPPPFLATGLNVSDQSGDGIVKVSWSTPADLSDFAGFKVYDLQTGSKVLVQTCTCSGPGCPTGSEASECIVSGLDSNRTYRFFASAFDLAGNETHSTTLFGSLSPSYVFKTDDETAPVFSSNLSVNVNLGNGEVRWDTAVDNQYVPEPSTIEYTLYRKAGSNYTNALTPWVDGTLIYTGTSPEYDDPTVGWNPGELYYFVVCAQDQYGQDNSGNITCDGNVSISIADNVAPTISGVSVSEDPNTSTWNLTATITDNIAPEANISIAVYRKFSDDPSDTASNTDDQVFVGNSQVGSFTLYSDAISNDSAGTNHFAHYLIVASDPDANQTIETHRSIRRAPQFQTNTTLSQACTEDIVCTASHTGASSTNQKLNVGLGLSTATVYISTPPGYGSISHCFGLNSTPITDVDCTYTPTTLNYFGSDSYEICAKDSVIDESISENYTNKCKTINITIAGVNDAPILSNNTHTVMWNEGGSANLDVMNGLVDVDSTGETFSVTSGTVTSSRIPYNLTCSGANCVLDFGSIHDLTNGQHHGEITFDYTVQDSNGASTTQSSTIKIYTPFTWTGNGGDTLISNGSNWCGSLTASISGTCSGAGSAPTTDSDIIFNELCETNCSSPSLTVDIDLQPRTLDIAENFGTLTVNSGQNISMTSCNYRRVLVRNGSTLDLSVASSSTFNELFVGDTSTFIAPLNMTIGCQSGTFTSAANNMTALGNGFSHNNGNVTLYAPSGTDYLNIGTSSSTSFYNLIVNSQSKDSSVIFTSDVEQNVANDLTVINGKLDIGNDQGDPTIYHMKIGGNLSLQYTNSSIFGQIYGGDIVMVGTSKTIEVQTGNNYPPAIILDEGASVSSLSDADLKLEHLQIIDGTFTSPSGNLTITPIRENYIHGANGSFNYSSFSDNDRLRGMLIETNGSFVHNSGKVIFKDTKTGYSEGRFQVALKAIPLTIFNDLEVDIADSGDIWTAVSYGGNEGVDGKFLVHRSSNLRVDGDILHKDGAIEGGDIDLRGNYETTCVGITGPCATGGSAEIYLNNSGQTLTLANTSSTPVIVINNGDTYNFSSSIRSLGGLRVLDGTVNAPAGTLNIGSERQSLTADNAAVMAEHGDLTEVLFEVDTASGAVFNHNNGKVKFIGRCAACASSGYTQGIGYANLIKTTSALSFYDVEFHVWNSYSGRALCFDFDSSSQMIVENDLTLGAQCLRQGVIKVAGDLVFQSNSTHGQDQPRKLSTNIVLNGTTNQTISKVGPFSWAIAWFDGNLTIDKSGSGQVDLNSDFSGDDSFATLTVGAGDTLNLNSNTINSASLVNSGTINP